MTRSRVDEITVAAFLIGLGCLFYVGIWPNVLFLISAVMIIRGMAVGRPRVTFQGAAWVMGVGIWAMLEWSVGALLIGVGVAMLIPVLLRRPSIFHSTKPYVDNYLD